MWALTNDENGRILVCTGFYDGRIHLRAPNGHEIKFMVGPMTAITYMPDRFVRVIGNMKCEYFYIPNEKMREREWEEILGDVAKFHAGR